MNATTASPLYVELLTLGLDAARYERGKNLPAREIVPGVKWAVESAKDLREYIVIRSAAGRWACQCADNMGRKLPCKHMAGVVVSFG